MRSTDRLDLTRRVPALLLVLVASLSWAAQGRPILVTGIVVDEANAPVAGAEVVMVSRRQQAEASDLSDARGVFFMQVDVGASSRVRVRRTGFRDAEAASSRGCVTLTQHPARPRRHGERAVRQRDAPIRDEPRAS
jgi:hypothetical protein